VLVVLALHYAEPHDRIVHPAKRLIVPLVGDRLCELIDIDRSERIELYVEMRPVGKVFGSVILGLLLSEVGELSGRPPAHARPPSRREPAPSRIITHSESRRLDIIRRSENNNSCGPIAKLLAHEDVVVGDLRIAFTAHHDRRVDGPYCCCAGSRAGVRKVNHDARGGKNDRHNHWP
jgi:hypothetical protein